MPRPENVRVTHSVEVTVNLGDFENVKPGYKISADVPEGGTVAETRQQLASMIDSWIEEDVDAWRGKSNR